MYNSDGGAVNGVGVADITYYPNNYCKIEFFISITSDGTDTTLFRHGINRDLINNVGASHTITPVSGGVLTYTKDGVSVESLTQYGGTFQGRGQFWVPSRLYQTDGGIGQWPESSIKTGLKLCGTCWGMWV